MGALSMKMAALVNPPAFRWRTNHLQTEAPVFKGEFRIKIMCTAYGSSNGNGRPGKGYQESGGYNTGVFSEQPKTAEGPNFDDTQDFEAQNISETLPMRGVRRYESRSGKVLPGSSSKSEDIGEEPYRIVDGQKVYLDELDVITLLEPPPYLHPLEPSSYNHAAFLWKKIGDIPEERRHRLLDLLLPRQITKMWELSKLRYDDPYYVGDAAASMLIKPELYARHKHVVWDGRVTQVPWYLNLFSRFQKVFFIGSDNRLYGRTVKGGQLLGGLADRLAPLYFQVRQVDSVMATEEPCDLVLEYADGHLHLCGSVPPGFPNPAKHLPPFNDKACDYLRVVGPGVIVGQVWVEGNKLEQYPRRLFGEFVLVQRFN